MATKKVNHILIVVFVVVSMAIIIIDFGTQFKSMEDPAFDKTELQKENKIKVDSMLFEEEDIRLPVDFQE